MSDSSTSGPSNTNRSGFDPSVDELPEGLDPWSDDVLRPMILKHRGNSMAKRQKLARDWFRSELFYNGIQWVTYDDRLRRWRELALRKSLPKPVTNMYAMLCDVFSSMLASIPVEVDYRPLSARSMIDRSMMQKANEMVEAIKQVTKFYKQQRAAAPKLARHGEVFLIPRLVVDNVTVDNEADEAPPALDPLQGGSLLEIMKNYADRAKQSAPLPSPDQMNEGGQSAQPNPTVPESPNANSALIPSPATPEQEPSESETKNFWKEPGIPKLVIDVASTFECYMDEEAETAADSAFFIREKSCDVGKLKTMFPKFADSIRPMQRIVGDVSRYYAGSLTRLTSGEFGAGGYFVSNDNRSLTRGNLTEYWLDPCPNYPEGIYAMMVNDFTIVYKDSLPYSDCYGKKFKNVIHIPAKSRTNNVHGRTPMDDAIAKQKQRNKVESFIELIIYRMAAPHWLFPKDCGITNASGEPGSSYYYNRVSAGGNSILKPEIVPGIPPHPILIQWLDKIDTDTRTMLGITDALLGQIPAGLPAARALELAMQRSRERHGDIFQEWNEKWADCLNMCMCIVRQAKPKDLFQAIKDDYGGFKTKMFEDDDFDLDLEIISETQQPAPPRSTASELSLVEDILGRGVLNMPPDIQYNIFQRFSLEWINKSLESDKEYISRENYLLINQGVVPQVRPFDNQPLHYEDHRIFRQSDQFLDWAEKNPQQAQQFDQHIAAHQQAMQPPPQAQMPPQGAPKSGAVNQPPKLAAVSGV